ncbi:hypothetical protein ACSNOK_24005, partial [Streptomyces sp. URMC 126]
MTRRPPVPAAPAGGHRRAGPDGRTHRPPTRPRTVPTPRESAHPEVRRRYPALAQAVLAGASGQLRN